ncbi:16608_t:CDS:2, partial [Dentiscutata erythropus]
MSLPMKTSWLQFFVFWLILVNLAQTSVALPKHPHSSIQSGQCSCSSQNNPPDDISCKDGTSFSCPINLPHCVMLGGDPFCGL